MGYLRLACSFDDDVDIVMINNDCTSVTTGIYKSSGDTRAKWTFSGRRIVFLNEIHTIKVVMNFFAYSYSQI